MNKPFSSWKTGAPYYLPLVILGLGAVAYFVQAGQWYWGVLALAPGLFTLNFFRDPPRRITTDEREIVSPADGLVVDVSDMESTPHYDGPCKRVAIFLNVFNVHINRAPNDGTITRIDYKKGDYHNAASDAASELNEANTIRLDTPHGPMTVRQIAGLVARRIVCPRSVGDSLTKGEKFGMIKFGSRTELFLPVDAEITVSKGDKVKGGSSVLARMP